MINTTINGIDITKILFLDIETVPQHGSEFLRNLEKLFAFLWRSYIMTKVHCKCVYVPLPMMTRHVC